MRKNVLIVSLLFVVGLISMNWKVSPKNMADDELVAYDISKFGIPVVVMAPPGAEVSKSELGSMEIEGIKMLSVDIAKDMFILNVSMIDMELEGESLSDLVESSIENVEEETGFEIIKQDEGGFIYKTNDPDIGLDHSFSYIMIKDDKEISFTTGLSMFDNFSLEDVEIMYAASKLAK